MLPFLFFGMAAAIADTNFDLQCDGEKKTINLQLVKTYTEPFSQRFRIDLASKRWCAEQCSLVSAIDDVRDDAIILEKANTQPAPGQLFTVHQVSRVTGEYTLYVKDRTGSVAVKAACRKLEFSGFPKINRQF